VDQLLEGTPRIHSGRPNQPEVTVTRRVPPPPAWLLQTLYVLTGLAGIAIGIIAVVGGCAPSEVEQEGTWKHHDTIRMANNRAAYEEGRTATPEQLKKRLEHDVFYNEPIGPYVAYLSGVVEQCLAMSDHD
jgi:hypothetical protein